MVAGVARLRSGTVAPGQGAARTLPGLQRGGRALEAPPHPLFLCSTGGTGGWSAKGCELLSRNRTHVACRCSHAASSAVLMDVSRREVGTTPRATPAHLASVSRDPSLWKISLAPTPTPL